MHVINNNINEKKRGTKETLHYEKSSQFQEMRRTKKGIERKKERGGGGGGERERFLRNNVYTILFMHA